jgi:hypothetical protein
MAVLVIFHQTVMDQRLLVVAVVVRVQQEAIAEVVLQGLVETAHHLQFRVHQ